jgi:Na+-transporting NADH:ubiquinone oxidoreductase subunit NqrB
VTRSPHMPATQELHLRGRHVPVQVSRWGDPRLKLATVLLIVQVLGQTVLEFNLSIAQILVTVGVSAAIEMTVIFWRRRVLAWPASAMLTGNSVALLLRSSDTEHGDWWSLNGIEYFVLAAVLSLLGKYLIRARGKHLFNPSNIGLVWTFVLVGPFAVYPQWLYWGPLGVPVVLTVSFLATFAVLVGMLAASGHGFFATWQSGPVTGWLYWTTIVLSPETLIFVFFMMSDPQTTPGSRTGRIAFGVASAAIATGLIATQSTETGVKLALLSSLTVTTALMLILDRVRRHRMQHREVPATSAATEQPRRLPERLRIAALPIMASTVLAVGAVIYTASLAYNEALLLLEQGSSDAW